MDRREFLVAAAAGSFALALDPLALAARLKGSPVALVTADLESHVVVVDLETARPINRIETAPGPRAIEYVRGRFGSAVLVVHTEHGVVSLIGAESLSVRRSELEAFESPRYACARPRDRFIGAPLIAYVTDSAAEEIVALDLLGRGKVLWRTRVPGPARHISISPDGRTIWTVLGTKADRLAVVDTGDPQRPRFARTVRPPFLAHDVVFAPDGEHVWVTSGSERQIAIYRRGSRSPVRLLAADAPPQHVAFAGGRAFVASGDDGTIRVHRQDGTLVDETEVPVGSYNVCFGARRGVTPSLSRGTVAVLDSRGRVRATRKIARAAHDACVVGGA
jgi:hypothetical protein